MITYKYTLRGKEVPGDVKAALKAAKAAEKLKAKLKKKPKKDGEAPSPPSSDSDGD